MIGENLSEVMPSSASSSQSSTVTTVNVTVASVQSNATCDNSATSSVGVDKFTPQDSGPQQVMAQSHSPVPTVAQPNMLVPSLEASHVQRQEDLYSVIPDDRGTMNMPPHYDEQQQEEQAQQHLLQLHNQGLHHHHHHHHRSKQRPPQHGDYISKQEPGKDDPSRVGSESPPQTQSIQVQQQDLGDMSEMSAYQHQILMEQQYQALPMHYAPDIMTHYLLQQPYIIPQQQQYMFPYIVPMGVHNQQVSIAEQAASQDPESQIRSQQQQITQDIVSTPLMQPQQQTQPPPSPQPQMQPPSQPSQLPPQANPRSPIPQSPHQEQKSISNQHLGEVTETPQSQTLAAPLQPQLTSSASQQTPSPQQIPQISQVQSPTQVLSVTPHTPMQPTTQPSPPQPTAQLANQQSPTQSALNQAIPQNIIPSQSQPTTAPQQIQQVEATQLLQQQQQLQQLQQQQMQQQQIQQQQIQQQQMQQQQMQQLQHTVTSTPRPYAVTDLALGDFLAVNCGTVVGFTQVLARETYSSSRWSDEWIKIRWLEFMISSSEGDVYRPGIVGIINKRTVLCKAYLGITQPEKNFLVTPNERARLAPLVNENLWKTITVVTISISPNFEDVPERQHQQQPQVPIPASPSAMKCISQTSTRKRMPKEPSVNVYHSRKTKKVDGSMTPIPTPSTTPPPSPSIPGTPAPPSPVATPHTPCLNTSGAISPPVSGMLMTSPTSPKPEGINTTALYTQALSHMPSTKKKPGRPRKSTTPTPTMMAPCVPPPAVSVMATPKQDMGVGMRGMEEMIETGMPNEMGGLQMGVVMPSDPNGLPVVMEGLGDPMMDPQLHQYQDPHTLQMAVMVPPMGSCGGPVMGMPGVPGLYVPSTPSPAMLEEEEDWQTEYPSHRKNRKRKPTALQLKQQRLRKQLEELERPRVTGAPPGTETSPVGPVMGVRQPWVHYV
ncbi:hypothetical protein Pelo_5542 [Pelomyxa schiedti]|nr:hypothetical protein Pelo_5542 [Pelomyxa schiedti]